MSDAKFMTVDGHRTKLQPPTKNNQKLAIRSLQVEAHWRKMLKTDVRNTKITPSGRSKIFSNVGEN